MNISRDSTQRKSDKAASNKVDTSNGDFQVLNHTNENVTQNKLNSIANNSVQLQRLSRLQNLTSNNVTQQLTAQLEGAEEANPSFIIEDGLSAETGQMNKSVFLTTVRAEVTKVAADILSKIEQTPKDCPYIPYWFNLYQGKTVEEILKSIARFAPETKSAKDIDNYMHLLITKVSTSFQQFTASGTVNAPSELPDLHSELEPTKAVQKMSAERVAQLCGGNQAEEDEIMSRATTGGELVDDDDPAKGFLDDDFDDFKDELPQPPSYGAVRGMIESGQEKDVVLWRGTILAAVQGMEANSSAGYAANPNVPKPGRAAAQDQVGHGGKLPEFSTKTDSSWSAGSWLVVVRINTKYLAIGSASEEGFICSANAPLKVLAKVDRTIIKTGKRVNAS